MIENKSIVENLQLNLIKSLEEKSENLSKPELKGLSEIWSAMIVSGTSNTGILGNHLIKEYGHVDHTQKRIKRHLNREFDFDLWSSFFMDMMPEIKAENHKNQKLVISIDQTHLSTKHSIVMIAMQYQNRAIPLIWKTYDGHDNIGFERYESLLNKVHQFFTQLGFQPENIMFMADRFYACSSLLSWLQDKSWDYRLRLKQNSDVFMDKNLNKISDLQGKKSYFIDNVQIYEHITNLSWIHSDPKIHQEGWAIVSKQSSSMATALDYGNRWSIESMFSDFKSRGFDMQKTQLRASHRIDKIIFFIGLCFWFYDQKLKKNNT